MRNKLWVWGWEPSWLLCSMSDDDGGGDDGGGSDGAGDDGSSADGGSDDSSTDHSSSGPDGGSDTGGGDKGGADTGGSAGSGDTTGGGGASGAGGGGGGGGGDGISGDDGSSPSQEPGDGGKDGQNIDSANPGDTVGTGDTAGLSGPASAAGTPSGVSTDVGTALDTALGSAPAASPAGAAAAAGLPGGVSSALDVLGGNTPVSQALDNAEPTGPFMGVDPQTGQPFTSGNPSTPTPTNDYGNFVDPAFAPYGGPPTDQNPSLPGGPPGLGQVGGTQFAANAFGPNESILSDAPPIGAGPQNASLETVSSPFDLGGFANAPVGGLNSPFGAGPTGTPAAGLNTPTGSWTDSIGEVPGLGPGLGGPVGTAVSPGVAGLNSPFGAGPSPDTGLQVFDSTNPSWTDPAMMTNDLYSNQPAGPMGPAAAPSSPVVASGKGDQLAFPTQGTAGERIAAMDEAGGFPASAFPGAAPAVADSGVPTPTARPASAGLGVDSTGQPVLAGNDVSSPLDPTALAGGGNPTPVAGPNSPATDTSPISGPAAPSAPVGPDVADALSGATATPPAGDADGAGGGGAAAGSGSLANLITAPIPSGTGGPAQSPPFTAPGPVLASDGGGGNINPEAGIFQDGPPGGANPGATPQLPGGVPGPIPQPPPADTSIWPNFQGGNINPEAGMYDALNSAT